MNVDCTQLHSGYDIVFLLTLRLLVCANFFVPQVAERDPNQDCGWSSTRRGRLLCSMREEAASVS